MTEEREFSVFVILRKMATDRQDALDKVDQDILDKDFEIYDVIES
ncbi:hypothetical protein [Candidatus Borrarchaeum sp.]|nr:hypothetical protein [Candidatus Borrarchaeum sp.]